jgi:hypothetical protein
MSILDLKGCYNSGMHAILKVVVTDAVARSTKAKYARSNLQAKSSSSPL